MCPISRLVVVHRICTNLSRFFSRCLPVYSVEMLKKEEKTVYSACKNSTLFKFSLSKRVLHNLRKKNTNLNVSDKEPIKFSLSAM